MRICNIFNSRDSRGRRADRNGVAGRDLPNWARARRKAGFSRSSRVGWWTCSRRPGTPLDTHMICVRQIHIYMLHTYIHVTCVYTCYIRIYIQGAESCWILMTCTQDQNFLFLFFVSFFIGRRELLDSDEVHARSRCVGGTWLLFPRTGIGPHI